MIEEIILNYLKENASVEVFMQRPENPPAKYLLIEKTGSRQNGHVFTGVVAIQSYAPRLLEAADLNEEAKALTFRSIELDEICKVELNSDYNFTDPDAKQYRYQAIFNIVHY